MIEMRWLLDPKYHKNSPSGYQLQYRYELNTPIGQRYWSDWINVPYVSEDK